MLDGRKGQSGRFGEVESILLYQESKCNFPVFEPESSRHTYYAISGPSVSTFYSSLARGGRYHVHVAQLVQ